MSNQKTTSGAVPLNIGIYVVVALVFVVAVSNFFTHKKSVIQAQKETEQNSRVATSTTQSLPRYNKEVFDGIKTVAPSYIVFDGTNGEVVAEKNSTSTYPLASITKVMTALVAGKELSPSESVKIIDSDLSPLGSSGLTIGDIWKSRELISYTLSVSSNDGARALARTVGSKYVSGEGKSSDDQVKYFVSMMNGFAASNNLGKLSFNNESGLDISGTKAGAYGNAYDVAKMFWYAYKNNPELFETTTESIAYIGSQSGQNVARNTNADASHIPGLAVSKTGYTDLAHGNLGVVVEVGPGRPVVIVVLHSTKEARFSDVDKLRLATLEAMK